MDRKFISEGISLASKFRSEGINTEVYTENEKIGKQLKYASKAVIPFVVLIGEDEVKIGKMSLKTMSTGKQKTLHLEEVIEEVKTIMQK